ncbi:CDP-alcohol phosphatidyltransferase family protein [Ornithinimicrobium ciconiae]|uniref:CDP-alcohol phosphatidyltransferase family protein n=1 Tax=Ornithinimicrobium ciconiae TaxID=2594265 RepID=A0A516GAY3_9MICO|nr:CDP-alcohol phosphatidyltransferase family protein [Ornithinimicrobium ciconiae]QDO88686.1 CDP-alcohol phosphatidyltransferase family protein [Ornithinimicrobium ciconiae]
MSSTQQLGGGQGTNWNVPNILSTLRLVGVPVFLWALLTHQDVLALLVLMGSGISDYLDGKIARHYGLVTKLGQYLDPIADRLYIATTLFGLAWRDIIPWWLVVALMARDAFILAMYPTVRAYRVPVPPVHYIGKAATFNLLFAFPLLLLGQFSGWLGAVALPVGWAFVWWGTTLYWLGAFLYAWQVSVMVAQRRRQWQAVGA